MIYQMIPKIEGDIQIYARIDDDKVCRLTCSGENPEFQAWLAEGNTPLPPDGEST
jgi:hypothetical protein